MILMLTQDLMMSSSASAVARAQNVPFRTSANVTKALQRLSTDAISLLLIDLQMPGLNIDEISSGLGALAPEKRPHSIAYAQHVEIDLLKTARAAGMNEVFTRGQMNGALETLFAQYPGHRTDPNPNAARP